MRTELPPGRLRRQAPEPHRQQSAARVLLARLSWRKEGSSRVVFTPLAERACRPKRDARAEQLVGSPEPWAASGVKDLPSQQGLLLTSAKLGSCSRSRAVS